MLRGTSDAIKSGLFAGAMCIPGVGELGLAATMLYAGSVSMGLESADQLIASRGQSADMKSIYTTGAISAATAGIFKGLSKINFKSPISQSTQTTSIKGTSYDINKLYKTQPEEWINEGVVDNMKASIMKNGPEAIPRIPVRVHNGNAMVIDGHHRLQAFSELGYERVPIKYISENQIKHYGRTLEELLELLYI